MIAEGLTEVAIRYPSVPIVFCDTRALAQEWAYRFLGAATAEHHRTTGAAELAALLPVADELPEREPTTAEVRVWARGGRARRPRPGRVPAETWLLTATPTEAKNTDVLVVCHGGLDENGAADAVAAVVSDVPGPARQQCETVGGRSMKVEHQARLAQRRR